AEALLNGLVIADVGQNLLEDGQLCFRAWDWQTRLRHQDQQADRLQRYRFAAGVGTADQQRAALRIQLQGDRLNGFALPPQHIFQKRVPRRPQQQLLPEAGNDAVELHGEAAFCEQNLELAHGDQCLPDRLGVTAAELG